MSDWLDASEREAMEREADQAAHDAYRDEERQRHLADWRQVNAEAAARTLANQTALFGPMHREQMWVLGRIASALEKIAGR